MNNKYPVCQKTLGMSEKHPCYTLPPINLVDWKSKQNFLNGGGLHKFKTGLVKHRQCRRHMFYNNLDWKRRKLDLEIIPVHKQSYPGDVFSDSLMFQCRRRGLVRC